MGFPNGWQALQPAGQARTLTQIAVSEGFESNRRGERVVRVGVDSSIWMNQAQTVWMGNGLGTQAGENPALRILFFRLCHLITVSVTAVFIFDGQDRPHVKRGRDVRASTPHWLTAFFQRLIEAFGFHWYTENIRADPRVGLTQAGLFLMVILIGGDYDPVGLPGCGITIAHQLARGRLAEPLFQVSLRYSKPSLQTFLFAWCKELQEELTLDPDGVLGRKHPRVAHNVTHSFPKIDTLYLYAKPLTTWSEGGHGPDTSLWIPRQPDLPRIASLRERLFSWGTSGTLVNHFRKRVWPGVAIQYLIRARNTNTSLQPRGPFAHTDALHIQRQKLGPSGPATGANVQGYSVEIETASLMRVTLSSLSAEIRNKVLEEGCPKTHIWVPGSILRYALPGFVSAYTTSRRSYTPCPIPPNTPRPILFTVGEDVAHVAAAASGSGASGSIASGSTTSGSGGSSGSAPAASGSSSQPIVIDNDDDDEFGDDDNNHGADGTISARFLGFIDLS